MGSQRQVRRRIDEVIGNELLMMANIFLPPRRKWLVSLRSECERCDSCTWTKNLAISGPCMACLRAQKPWIAEQQLVVQESEEVPRLEVWFKGAAQSVGGILKPAVRLADRVIGVTVSL